jgi:hypothetical protein
MKRASSHPDREARIKATASFLHASGALRTREETHTGDTSRARPAIAPAEDAAARDVWWWTGRIVAAVAFAAAVVAPWVLLLAECVLNRELPR